MISLSSESDQMFITIFLISFMTCDRGVRSANDSYENFNSSANSSANNSTEKKPTYSSFGVPVWFHVSFILITLIGKKR